MEKTGFFCYSRLEIDMFIGFFKCDEKFYSLSLARKSCQMKVTYIYQKQSFADVLQDHQDIREIVFSPSNKVIYFDIYCTVITSCNTRFLTYTQIQWTLSISTTLYLELLSISNKKLGPLDIYGLCKLFLSFYLELLSRIFLYFEQKSWSLLAIFLSIISHFFY